MTTIPSRNVGRLMMIRIAVAVMAGAAVGGRSAMNVDASKLPAPPSSLSFHVGGVSPAGLALAVNDRYFTRSGCPWIPVMGEFHFARYPADEWEREILKIKAGGVDIVATYVHWIFHEETEGQFDWTGQRNLGEFLRLCAKLHMMVWLRIGPWSHGEVRNGGFPDWLVGEKTRQNDPVYLGHVRTYFDQIGRQASGMLWKDGGPIVGIQIENEYHPAGDGSAHMEQLLKLAREAGLDAPFYSATGWDQAAIPAADFLPVFGGYTDNFWSDSPKELPPSQEFFFTPIRAFDNVDLHLQRKDRRDNDQHAGYPYLTAEMGGGMAVAYHRRPVMQADDSTAAALVRLGSGATLLGYYMYHGGTNPDGKTSMQETLQAWNGYNDLEAKSYDFQAPLGEFGQMRPTYRTMKALHLFLNDFGDRLAPMVTYFPDQKPRGLDDRMTPRIAVRSDGKSAFVFINNYQRTVPLPDRPDFQVALQLPAGTLRIPRRPMSLPGGAYTIWPVNLDVGGVTLEYATAALTCRIADPETYIFHAWPGVNAEFSFRLAAGDIIEAPQAQVAREDGRIVVSGIEPGTETAIRVSHPGQKRVQIVVLTRAQALNLWKASLGGRDRLLLSPAGLFFEGDRVHLYSRNPTDFTIGVFPVWSGAAAAFRDGGSDGVFHRFVATVNEAKAAVHARQTKTAAPALPARINADPLRKIAKGPEDADFDLAAVWSIEVPAGILSAAARPVLTVDYEGDAARLYAGGRFVDDNFYKGTTFEFGLWRLAPEELQKGIELKILPLRKDTPLYLPASATLAFDQKGESLRLKDVALAWDYEVVLPAAR